MCYLVATCTFGTAFGLGPSIGLDGTSMGLMEPGPGEMQDRRLQ
jgi:hypothetical protein